MKKKEREFVEVDEVAIKRMIAGDMPPYLEKEEKQRRAVENDNEPGVHSGEGIKEGKDENADNSKSSRKRKTVKDKDSYRETFLQQPKTAGCRQSTLNLDERNHSAIKKMLKTTDGLSMAGFVNNVLRHHFREYSEETAEIRRSYMSELYKEDEL